MKVRLTDNDIRLRLSEFEVAMVLEGRPVVATVSEDLVITLVPSNVSASSLEVGEHGNIVKMPADQVIAPSMHEPLMYRSPADSVPHVLVEMDRPR